MKTTKKSVKVGDLVVAKIQNYDYKNGRSQPRWFKCVGIVVEKRLCFADVLVRQEFSQEDDPVFLETSIDLKNIKRAYLVAHRKHARVTGLVDIIMDDIETY